MKLLYKYILTQFFKHLLTITSSFIAIYLLIDFFEKIDNFMDRGKSMQLVMEFFLLNIPFIIDQMGPVCILLTGVVTLGLLNHSNELIALKAGGIPLRTITAPIILAAMGVTLLLLTLNQMVLPKTVARTNEIWNREIKKQVPLGIYRNGRYYYRSKEGFYSFARPDPKKDNFHFFSYTTWNDQYKIDTLVAAVGAVWDGTWRLADGLIQTSGANNNYTTEVFDRKAFNFSERPEDFFVPEDYTKELSLVGLYMDAQRKDSPDERNKVLAEFWGRLSYIFLGLPLLLLGLPLLLMVYRKWGRDLSVAIPVSCGMAFACWGVWGTLQSLARAGYLNPLIAAITVHLLMGTAGMYLLLREDL
ncbi:MAG: permease [Desulfobulbus propionicus]|nr:MAG: permease [Desulfobulbus propionicus]